LLDEGLRSDMVQLKGVTNPPLHILHIGLENWFQYVAVKIKKLSAIFRAKSQKVKPKSLGTLRVSSQRIKTTLKIGTFPKRLFSKTH